MLGFALKVIWVLQILGLTKFSWWMLILVTVLYLIQRMITEYLLQTILDEQNDSNDDEDNDS